MQTLSIFKNKNVLITGGSGFIGSYLVRMLLELAANVYVLDNLSTGSLENLPESPNLFFYNGSILDRLFAKQFLNINFDYIIHLASVVGMRLATKQQQLVYKTATTGTQNVMDAFPDVPIVLFSSSAVYGMENRLPVKEYQPISYSQLLKYDGGKPGYACGKWEMEQIGLRASEKGRKVIIVRPFNVIGNRQVGTYGMVLPTFIKQALNGEPLTVLDDGFQVRSFSCVETFTECLFKLLDKSDAWIHGNNIFNMGTQKGNSINELAKIVIEETGSKSSIQYLLYQDIFPNHTDVIYRVPDTSHGEKYFGKTEWPTLRQIVNKVMKRKELVTVS